MAALLALALPSLAGAAPVTLSFPTVGGDYKVTFDPQTLPEEDLRAFVRLSPHLHGWESYAVAPRLEHCVAGDPDYRECGARAPGSAHFDWNARRNLERGAALLAEVGRLRAPRELEPVVEYSRRSLAFSLWLETTKFEFYRTGDAGVLARPYEGLEPAAHCGAALDRVRAAAGPEDRYHHATYTWHNCVNAAYRARLGGYPLDAWEAFVRRHGIQEAVLEPFGAGR